MNSHQNSDTFAGKTEILCETIIEALRELRSTTTGPVTPTLLSRSLIRNSSYIDTLDEAARQTDRGNDLANIKSYARRLQQFQVNLLGIFESAFAQDSGTRVDEFCLLAEKKNHIEELFELNAQILDFVSEVSGKAARRQNELLNLLGEVTKNLFEVERFVSVSFSNAKKAYRGSKVFSDVLEQNVTHISRILDTSRSLEELKSLITSKLEAIREASKMKMEVEKQVLRSASEIVTLKSQIKMMRKQISKAHRRADNMEKASLLDPLTEVANRRSYQKHIRHEWDAYTHSKEAFSILMIDIDNFKSINDSFGHWAGDKCLSELARRIKLNLRGTDFIARYGGEEFIAVLPKTEKAGAVAVAEKLRSHIEQTRFLYRKDRIPLTISVGVSTVRETDQSIRSILDRVDKGLYQAKDNGRNQVSIV